MSYSWGLACTECGEMLSLGKICWVDRNGQEYERCWIWGQFGGIVPHALNVKFMALLEQFLIVHRFHPLVFVSENAAETFKRAYGKEMFLVDEDEVLEDKRGTQRPDWVQDAAEFASKLERKGGGGAKGNEQDKGDAPQP